MTEIVLALELEDDIRSENSSHVCVKIIWNLNSAHIVDRKLIVRMISNDVSSITQTENFINIPSFVPNVMLFVEDDIIQSGLRCLFAPKGVITLHTLTIIICLPHLSTNISEVSFHLFNNIIARITDME